MSAIEPILSIEGSAADHLYREGSAKASFWEALFGSSLSARRRTHVSALADGTRRFEVPLREVEDKLLNEAASWFGAADRAEVCREARTLVAARGLRVSLVGLQPSGLAVAAFTLRFEPLSGPVSPEIKDAFRRWFDEDGPRLAREVLLPFGFTYRPA